MNSVGWTGGFIAPIVVGFASDRFGLGIAIGSTAAVYLLVGLLAFQAARLAEARPSGVGVKQFRLSHCGGFDGEIYGGSSSGAAGGRYGWAQRGDVNAFFGLMLDNIGVMILMGSLLVAAFKMPRTFVLTRMIPGTAVGVLVGDLIYTAMAFRLARRTGRTDVTAMPLGLDTPSTFGTVFLIIGPAYQEATGARPGHRNRSTSCLVLGHYDAAGIGDLQTCVCTFFGLDQKNRAAGGVTGIAGSDRAGADQFSAVAGHRGPSGGGHGGAGLDPGDADGALAVSASRFRGAGGGGDRLLDLLRALRRWDGGRARGARGASRMLALRAVLPLPIQDWFAWFSRVGREMRSGTCRWRFRWRWRRWWGASTAPRVPPAWAMSIRPGRSSRPRGWRRSSAGFSAG